MLLLVQLLALPSGSNAVPGEPRGPNPKRWPDGEQGRQDCGLPGGTQCHRAATAALQRPLAPTLPSCPCTATGQGRRLQQARPATTTDGRTSAPAPEAAVTPPVRPTTRKAGTTATAPESLSQPLRPIPSNLTAAYFPYTPLCSCCPDACP